MCKRQRWAARFVAAIGTVFAGLGGCAPTDGIPFFGLSNEALDALHVQERIVGGNAERLLVIRVTFPAFASTGPSDPNGVAETEFGVIDLATGDSRLLPVDPVEFADPVTDGDSAAWVGSERTAASAMVVIVDLRSGDSTNALPGLDVGGTRIVGVAAISDEWLVLNGSDPNSVDPAAVVLDRANEEARRIDGVFTYGPAILEGDRLVFIEEPTPEVLRDPNNPDGIELPPLAIEAPTASLVLVDLRTGQRSVLVDDFRPANDLLRSDGARVLWSDYEWNGESSTETRIRSYDLASGALETLHIQAAAADSLESSSDAEDFSGAGMLITRAELGGLLSFQSTTEFVSYDGGTRIELFTVSSSPTNPQVIDPLPRIFGDLIVWRDPETEQWRTLRISTRQRGTLNNLPE